MCIQLRTAKKAICPVIEEGDIPFSIERIFYVYDALENAKRGKHANRILKEFLVCLQGSIEIQLESIHSVETFTLDSPEQGIYIPAMTWIDIEILKPGTIYMVLASEPYDQEDAIRDYNEFQSLKNKYNADSL